MIRAVIALSAGLAAAFVAPAVRSQNGMRVAVSEKSEALPFEPRPANLDGSLVGDVGFDPCGLSANPPAPFSLKWYREAEIVHGRIAQLAVVGFLVPSFFHFAGNPDFGVPADAFAELNPYKALSTVPADGLWQIGFGILCVELYRIKRVIIGSDKEPGDLGLGQGGWNPFNFNYTPEEYKEKQLQEIKHGRLAMFGALGMLLQSKIAGVGVVQQLSGAFTLPSEREFITGPGALGDYFPQGL